MKNDLAIIIVPGGLGTKLSLDGTRVWDFDLPSLHLDGVRMLADPALLLPWVPLKPGGLLSVYDKLVDFIVARGYVKNTSLFRWGYDWRLGMEANANQLAAFVSSLNLGNKKILFIAHSAGCMIVRWALHIGTPANPAQPLINNALVKHVVAAGPYMLGMACAFKDMLTMPRLNDTFDTLFALLKVVYPSLAAQTEVPLRNTLRAVTGQLEALPPNSVPILSGGSGPPSPPFGVFNWRGWPSELAGLRTTVQTTQGQLAAANWGQVPCTVIASSSHKTETGYALDAGDQYQSDSPLGDGDGSVLLPSAQAYCPSGTLQLVAERHRTLLDDPAARTLLDTLI